VELLLQRGADPQSKGRNDKSVLAIACEKQHVVVFRHLLLHGARANPNGKKPEDLLAEAFSRGNYEIVEMLVKAAGGRGVHGDLNPHPFDQALSQVSSRQFVPISLVKSLLSAGADTNFRSVDGPPFLHGYTPLAFACSLTPVNLYIVRLLLEAGADAKVPGLEVPTLLLEAFKQDWVDLDLLRALWMLVQMSTSWQDGDTTWSMIWTKSTNPLLSCCYLITGYTWTQPTRTETHFLAEHHIREMPLSSSYSSSITPTFNQAGTKLGNPLHVAC
jgi:ankyrin repeat protein